MTQEPPVTIESKSNDDETQVYNVSESTRNFSSPLDVDAIYSQFSEDTFLVGLEQEGQYVLNGTGSALRVAQDSLYSSDPSVALAQYATRLLGLCGPRQGEGWMYVDNYRDIEIPVIVESVQIMRERGSAYEFDFNIELIEGSGMMPESTLPLPDADPDNTAELDGFDLTEIEQLMINQRIETQLHTYALHDSEENEVEAQSGVIRDFMVQGTKPGDEVDRKEFDLAMQGIIGQQEIVEFNSAFPGQSYDVMVSDFESSREAGQTELGSYRIEMVEGRGGTN